MVQAPVMLDTGSSSTHVFRVLVDLHCESRQYAATGMYGSYVFLFGHMLMGNVCGDGGGGGERTKKKMHS